MTIAETSDTPAVTLDYELDAPPEKVWRALTIPAFLDRWLLPVEAGDGVIFNGEHEGPAARIETEIVEADPPRLLRWRWREAGASGDDGTVSFILAPTPAGGTSLRLVHQRTMARLPRAANANLMLARAA